MLAKDLAKHSESFSPHHHDATLSEEEPEERMETHAEEAEDQEQEEQKTPVSTVIISQV